MSYLQCNQMSGMTQWYHHFTLIFKPKGTEDANEWRLQIEISQAANNCDAPTTYHVSIT